ncbi:Glycine zipper 2TM domain-containing protein [Sphingomonas laterariae]|uniref:17 kDa surface antigen n=2 Tax=Edaphosphingomonas laterariae TaxID=861865 RepID=A0A239BTY9_9SPHN|nr:Glycine zipper 2TM domain-containing protein [Sphingomonas laterariae]
MLALGAASLAIPAAMVLPTDQVEARRHHHYQGKHRDYRRSHCRKSSGTTGLIVGGAGGALLGRAVDTRGDRTTGTVVGAAAGALLGKEIDSKRRC